MIEFIYAYGDIVQFIVYVFNSLAVAVAVLVAACYWVKFVKRTTSCCSGDKAGHGFHGHMGHHGHHGAKSECCSDAPAATETPAADVDVTKFVD